MTRYRYELIEYLKHISKMEPIQKTKKFYPKNPSQLHTKSLNYYSNGLNKYFTIKVI